MKAQSLGLERRFESPGTQDLAHGKRHHAQGKDAIGQVTALSPEDERGDEEGRRGGHVREEAFPVHHRRICHTAARSGFRIPSFSMSS